MAALKGPPKSPNKARKRVPSQADYEALSQFRYLIRCFMEFSQEAAKAEGLTPRQHQALLAIRGFPGGGPVTIGDLAEREPARASRASPAPAMSRWVARR
ncbi:MarR family transcriptional regulator, partial [Escherichia coli]|nr:MarR family transcriptional regulator [Escherichia coli]